jgi:flagellar biosynthesis protein FlhA
VTLAVGDARGASSLAAALDRGGGHRHPRCRQPRLAGQIGGQFANPATWLPVAVILGAIGFIPAMPHMIFLPAAAMTGWIWWSLRKRAERLREAEIAPPPPQTDPSRITLDEVSDHTLVTIELGYGLVHLVDEKRGSPLVARVTGVRKQLSQACGFIVPQFRVRDRSNFRPTNIASCSAGCGSAARSPVPIASSPSTGEARPGHGLVGEATRDPALAARVVDRSGQPTMPLPKAS